MVINTAGKVISKEGRALRNGWCDEESAGATKNKNEAYFKMIQKNGTRGTEDGYQEMRRIEKGSTERKRRNTMKNKLKRLKNYTERKRAEKCTDW
jgi:hypothetical protein